MSGERSLRLIMLGPPGAGKGTQAQILERRFGAKQISTGDLLRRHRAERTPLGLEAQGYMDRGELVPDDLIISMVEVELRGLSSFILDGFPRTVPQAEALEALLARLELPLDAVLSFEATREELVRRLTARWVNPRNGRIYNAISLPPRTPGIDDADGLPLEQRVDDRPETVNHRLDVYDRQTAPLIAFYAAAGKLARIDALADIETVTGEIDRVLERSVSESAR